MWAPIEAFEYLGRMAAEGWGTGSPVGSWLRAGRGMLGSANGWREVNALGPTRRKLQNDIRPVWSRTCVPCSPISESRPWSCTVETTLLSASEAGRYRADSIAGAKYVELPGEDHWFFVGDSDAIVDEIEEFLTGARNGTEGDVVVSTVLFTDIVDSTRQEAAVGHRPWSKLIAEHDALVRAAIGRHRGREIKTTGDGFLVTFDGASRAIRCATEIVTRGRKPAWPCAEEYTPARSSSEPATSRAWP